MRDVEDPDDGGGRIPPVRTMAGEPPKVTFVTEGDFGEHVERQYAEHVMVRRWLFVLTAVIVVLVIALVYTANVNRGQGKLIASLKKAQQAQAALIGTKAGASSVSTLIARQTARSDSIDHRLTTMGNRVGFIATKVNLVEGKVSSEDFVTRTDLDQALSNATAYYEKQHTTTMQTLADSLAANRASMRVTLAAFSADQERSFQLLRTSVDADISSVKLANRAALGLGILNTAWQAVHVSGNRK